MSDITFSDAAWDEYQDWLAEDRKTVKRINNLLKEIQLTPFDGTGKPEPLKGDKSGNWSRRISEKDRIVYQYNNGTVTVLQCKGHYDDK